MKFKNLESEFLITDHARDMMLLRFGCNADKVKKVAIKAWVSRCAIDKAIEFNKKKNHKNDIYRFYNGYIFVFVLKHIEDGVTKKRLITVYNPKKDIIER